STFAAQAIRTGDSRCSVNHRCSCNRSLAVPARPILQPVRTVDCGLAVRKSKRRQGKRLLGRWDTGRNPDALIKGWRSESDIAHVNAVLQEQAGKSAGNRKATWRCPHFGGKRAEEHRHRAGERSTD